MCKLNLDEKYKSVENFSREFVKDLLDSGKFKFVSKHKTYIRHLYDNNETEKFIEIFANELRFSLMINEFKDDKLKFDFKCGACGKYVHYMLEDGVLSSEDEECFEIAPYSFEVAFPSGKVIFDDWPEYASELLNELDDDEVSINAFKGCVLRSQRYASQNVLHVFVGNTCPSVYYKNGLIVIGNNRFEEDKKIYIPLMEDAEQKDSICTDLWWATGVDYEVYKKMAIEKFGEQEGTEKIDELFKKCINIKPGIYKVTHYFDSVRATTGKEPDMFTKLEWVRDVKEDGIIG